MTVATVELHEAPPFATQADDTDWMEAEEGQALKLLRILPGCTGYVALLRVDPGCVIPPHRHTGVVHAYHLSGSRRIHTGDVIGPGGFVYEPAGNLDSWEVVGDEPCVMLIVVEGEVEYLTPDGEVTKRYTAAGMQALHERWCAAAGAEPFDLSSEASAR
ncbi:MAG: hypothetical protein PVI23_05475 [Maricaulaceae bacterium]|jgi:quercetin dioxygenase-like cupin family protein